MASRQAVIKAMARGYNVRTVDCQCPHHPTGASTVVPPQAGKTVMMTVTDYGYFCKECYHREFTQLAGSPQGGQNALTGASKSTVNTGRTAQFAFTTGRQDIAERAKASCYGIKAQGKGYRVTSPQMNNVNGIGRQWKSWGLPHNTTVQWTVKDRDGRTLAQGKGTPKQAIAQARLYRGTI